MKRICKAVRLDRALSDFKSADVHGVVIGVYRKCFNVLVGSGTIVSVFVNTGCGSDLDPQGLAVQRKILEDAGVIVMDTNGEAARLAAMIIKHRRELLA